MPQPFNQRSLSKTPQTANEKDELGRWKDGRFTFDSPEAEVTWHQRAYAQGIHPQDWHRGREVDAETAKLVEAGLAGATPPYYRGPDGTPRFGNQPTIEPPARRALRQRAFAGKTLDQINAIHCSTGKLPGENEAAALILGNDNQSPHDLSDSAAALAHSPAILAGMQHARESKPHVVARLAQATVPNDAPNEDQLPLEIDAKPSPRMSAADSNAISRGPQPAQEPQVQKPSAPIDAPRKAELFVFQPVGDGKSSFGHVAIEINGLLYSWTPSGLHLTTKADYLKENDFRDGIGYPLRLTDSEADKLESYFIRYANVAHYNPALANCTDPIEQGLESLGYDVGLTVVPAQLQQALFASELASSDRSTFYPAVPNKKSPIATRPWSVLSQPEGFTP